MRLFVLLSRVPYPIEKGDKLRAYHQLRYLSKNNEIILCALNDLKPDPSAIEALKPYCKSIHVINLSKFCILSNMFKAFLKGKPLQIGYFYSKKAQKKIDRLINETRPDHIYCQLVRVTEYVKSQKIPKTLDYQDVFSKGVERRIYTDPFYLRPVLKLEYKRLLKYEEDIFDYFDQKTIISIPDRNLIPHPDRNKISIILNGVDYNFFKPMEIEKEYDIVFTGNMAYAPNVNAAIYLAQKVLPLVHKKKPSAKLLLAGATPHANVVALKSDKVEVTGWVDDIRECYAKAKVFIAPMQIGIGLQNKLLEAMAMKIPCITSQLANNALEAREGVEILIGYTPEEYASHILYLLNNSNHALELAEKGYKFVKEHYSWEVATRKLENLMKQGY